jgi:cytochrome o ubiquinol oxidase operon protein cyoD
MSQHKVRAVVADIQPSQMYTLKTYVIGFGLSIVLTLIAYLAVVNHLFSRRILLFVLPVTALAQFIVQLFCFMHLGREYKPRWKLYVFLFMVLIVIILVAGSIWIMANLNYHAQSAEQVNQYMRTQDRL